MKVLLDTSFLRHLSLVNGLSLIPTLTNKMGWKFIIPEIVIDELNQKNTDRMIKQFMKEGIIQNDYCTENEFSSIKQIVLGLDDGELEAICIVNKCDDRQFKKYLILTDDRPAQKKSSYLGMKSLDVISFLFLSNQKGFLDKEFAIKSITKLQKNDYFIDELVVDDFMKRLV